MTRPDPFPPVPFGPVPFGPVPFGPVPSRHDPSRPDLSLPDQSRPIMFCPVPSRPVPSPPGPSRSFPNRSDPTRPFPSLFDSSRPDPSRSVPFRPVPTRPIPFLPDPSRLDPSRSVQLFRSVPTHRDPSLSVPFDPGPSRPDPSRSVSTRPVPTIVASRPIPTIALINVLQYVVEFGCDFACNFLNQMALTAIGVVNTRGVNDRTSIYVCGFVNSVARSAQRVELQVKNKWVELQRENNRHVSTATLGTFNCSLFHKFGVKGNYAQHGSSQLRCSVGMPNTETEETVQSHSGSQNVYRDDDEGPYENIRSTVGLADACKFVYNDAKYVNERARSDIFLLSRILGRI